jgi:hypothetical protein
LLKIVALQSYTGLNVQQHPRIARAIASGFLGILLSSPLFELLSHPLPPSGKINL